MSLYEVRFEAADEAAMLALGASIAEVSGGVGTIYLHGDLGLDKNYQKAEKWLERAASQGHPEAKRYLSQAYSELAF